MRYVNRLTIIVIAVIILGSIPLLLLRTVPAAVHPPTSGGVPVASTPTPAASVGATPLPARQTGKVSLSARGFAPGETVTFRATVQPGDLNHLAARVDSAARVSVLQQAQA